MTTEVYLSVYCPGPVTACLTTGSGSFIGIVNDTTVLKYPHTPGDTAAFSRLQSEARMLQAIGSHQNIIGFKGLISEGLLLERASLGSVTEYLSTCNPASWQRLLWIYQVADALSRVHEKGVIHRDISTNNLLLDENLNIKLCDFQGRLVSLNGDILEDGLAIENTKSYMPRLRSEHADQKTDIFALGSAIYYIMEGHEPFPDLDPDDDEAQIMERFKLGWLPDIGHSLMNAVMQKCWLGTYISISAVLQDLQFAKAK